MVRVGLYEMMWRTDNNGQAISVNKTETIQVSTVYFNVVLDEIPDKFHGVEVSDSNGNYTEVRSLDMVTGKSFHVNYGEGIVTFDPSVGGRNLRFNYYGRGYKRIDAGRIVGFDEMRMVKQSNEEVDVTDKQRIKSLETMVVNLQKTVGFLVDEMSRLEKEEVNCDELQK